MILTPTMLNHRADEDHIRQLVLDWKLDCPVLLSLAHMLVDLQSVQHELDRLGYLPPGHW